MRYLKGNANLGLQFTGKYEQASFGYSVSDFAGDMEDKRSTSGYIFKYSGTELSWQNKKQTSVALSTAEAEYVALSSTT